MISIGQFVSSRTVNLWAMKVNYHFKYPGNYTYDVESYLVERVIISTRRPIIFKNPKTIIGRIKYYHWIKKLTTHIN